MSASHAFRHDVWADDPAYWAKCPECGRTEDEHEQHGYGDKSDCTCGRNFATVRGLREHLTKTRTREHGDA